MAKGKVGRVDPIREHYSKRKSMNTPEFNRMAKKRREKAKFDAKARKINQRRQKR